MSFFYQITSIHMLIIFSLANDENVMIYGYNYKLLNDQDEILNLYGVNIGGYNNSEVYDLKAGPYKVVVYGFGDNPYPNVLQIGLLITYRLMIVQC